jgi:phosphoglycerate dehydrogenase-like enzyme
MKGERGARAPRSWPITALALGLMGWGCRTSSPQVEGQPIETGRAVAEELGSTRNARIAVARAEQPPKLTFLAGELSEMERAELARAAPNVEIVAGLTRDSALEHAARAHGAVAQLVTSEFLERAPKLAWVQATSAGVDRFMGWAPIADGRVVLTNYRAVHGPAIADHAFALILCAARDLRFHLEQQAGGRWTRERSGRETFALQGRTLLVAGLGGIGSQVAARANGFGMRVLATRRSGTDKPAFVERVGGPADLREMLGQSDVVVICLPLTDETRGLFDTQVFEAMKPGAYLVNIARGAIVDTAALLSALESGRLAGACLDVTDPEPLPEGHPLWKRDDVWITPHVAGASALTEERGWALFLENMRRFGAGEPLLNVVDPRAGY